MFCSHCGKEIDDRAVVCVYCGVPTVNMANTPSNTVNPNAQQEVYEKKSNPCAITGFVLAIVGAVLGMFFYIPFRYNTGAVMLFMGFAFMLGIAGLVLSIVGLVKSKKCRSGKGLALAGTIVGALFVACYLAYYLMVFFVFLLFTMSI